MIKRNATAISVRHLSKRFAVYEKTYHPLLNFLYRGRRTFHREFWALRHISFDLPKGQSIGIVGPNGSGKSTLLQLICGTLKPTSGRVETDGRIAALLELGSGFNPEFTGRENVFFQAAILGLSDAQISKRFDEIAEFAEIGDFMEQPIKTYSSGMTVRLAFSTAIHVSPEILVVDEALAVGDTAFQTKCLSRIRNMQGEGVTILLVSHNTNTIVDFCDNALYLRDGELVTVGTPEDVTKRYSDDIVRAEGGRVLQVAGQSGRTEAQASARPHKVYPSSQPATEIQAVALLDQTGAARTLYQCGERMVVSVNIVANQRNLSPCFGLQIKSDTGIVLWTGTTDKVGAPVEPVVTAGSYTVSWTLTLHFSPNQYVLAVGAGSLVNGEYQRHSRMDYAGHFAIAPKPGAGTGWLEPFAQCQVRPADEAV